eukprot:12018010-Ditylum_brightwellii.AAC.1
MSDISKLAWLEAVKIAEHDLTVINKQTPCQCTITEMFRAQDTEQNMNANLATVNATIADDWSQADVWDGPDLI